MKPKEHDELVEHVFRVCRTNRALVRTGVDVHSLHFVEVGIPGRAALRVQHRVSGIATRRMLEIFRALPDGALSLASKRSALLASLASFADASGQPCDLCNTCPCPGCGRTTP